MTRKLPARGVLFRKQVLGARESLAKELYDIGAVFQAMAMAAAKGRDYLVVTSPEPIDLRPTAAAKDLAATLEREGFRCTWDRHENPAHPSFPAYFDLLIQWDTDTMTDYAPYSTGRRS